MNQLIQLWYSYISSMFTQTTVCICVILLLYFIFRKSSASFKYLILCLGLIRFLLPVELGIPFSLSAFMNNIAVRTDMSTNSVLPAKIYQGKSFTNIPDKSGNSPEKLYNPIQFQQSKVDDRIQPGLKKESKPTISIEIRELYKLVLFTIWILLITGIITLVLKRIHRLIKITHKFKKLHNALIVNIHRELCHMLPMV